MINNSGGRSIPPFGRMEDGGDLSSLLAQLAVAPPSAMAPLQAMFINHYLVTNPQTDRMKLLNRLLIDDHISVEDLIQLASVPRQPDELPPPAGPPPAEESSPPPDEPSPPRASDHVRSMGLVSSPAEPARMGNARNPWPTAPFHLRPPSPPRPKQQFLAVGQLPPPTPTLYPLPRPPQPLATATVPRDVVNSEADTSPPPTSKTRLGLAPVDTATAYAAATEEAHVHHRLWLLDAGQSSGGVPYPSQEWEPGTRQAHWAENRSRHYRAPVPRPGTSKFGLRPDQLDRMQGCPPDPYEEPQVRIRGMEPVARHEATPTLANARETAEHHASRNGHSWEDTLGQLLPWRLPDQKAAAGRVLTGRDDVIDKRRRQCDAAAVRRLEDAKRARAQVEEQADAYHRRREGNSRGSNPCWSRFSC